MLVKLQFMNKFLKILKDAIEDVLFNKSNDATENLIECIKEILRKCRKKKRLQMNGEKNRSRKKNRVCTCKWY